MKIELDFNIGDPLYYIMETKHGEGPRIMEIHRDENGIDGVKLEKDREGNLQTLILSDGDEELPGSQYACLTEDQALEWCRKNRSGSVLLPGSGTVKAIFFTVNGEREIVDLDCSLSGIEDYVGSSVVSGKVDQNGYFAVYDQCARRDGAPISIFLLDADGNPVDAMFGAFLLLRFECSSDGLSRLVDVDPEMMDPL